MRVARSQGPEKGYILRLSKSGPPPLNSLVHELLNAALVKAEYGCGGLILQQRNKETARRRGRKR